MSQKTNKKAKHITYKKLTQNTTKLQHKIQHNQIKSTIIQQYVQQKYTRRETIPKYYEKSNEIRQRIPHK